MSEKEPQPNDQITMFAMTNFRNQERRFGIKRDDRRRHMYLIGKTGMGKTNALEHMIIEDIKAGNGVAVVDPHGDLVERVIEFVPSYRINDVIYVNPADIDYPIGFNVLESVDPTQRHLVASGLMGVFTKIWEGVWSARMEYILNNAILALLEYPGSTMLGISRILVDKNYRRKVIAKLTDPIVKSFWVDEFAAYNTNFRNEAIAPIQNKVGQFLSNAIIRNMVGQPKSTINLRDIMDNRKILLLNLAKGRIGEDSSALLGAMMITRLQLAAMSRVDIPEEKRQDFYLYVDEFQNFATESFASILSEARKYRLDLIIAHQYIEQLDEKVRSAVFGNVGTIMSFRVGGEDAEFLAKEFFPTFTEDDLLNLTKYNVYMKLMIDGVASEPFSAITLPPLQGLTNNRDKIVRVSRERYGTPKKIVEEKIIRWSGVEEMYKSSAEEDNQEVARRPSAYEPSHLTPRSPKTPTVERQQNFSQRPPIRNTPNVTPERQQSFPPRQQKPIQKPKVNFNELESVAINENAKTISLSEALHISPKQFVSKHEERPRQITEQKRPPVPKIPDQPQSLRPGQVIRVN